MSSTPNPSPLPAFYSNRARATSFGNIADLYDRYRPDYPDELIDNLLARQPAPTQVLDIGCGTGKAALPLQARGLSVLGLEPDHQMAAVARAHGILVETANFETWDSAGRTFDLLVCGSAWHWIDPTKGIPKAAQLLRPGGTFAIFYNVEIPQEPIRSALDEIYARLEPQHPKPAPPPPEDLTASLPEDLFESEPTIVFPWTRTLTTAQWIGMVTTFSDHQILPPERLNTLQTALAEAINGLGGFVTVQVSTYTMLARRR